MVCEAEAGSVDSACCRQPDAPPGKPGQDAIAGGDHQHAKPDDLRQAMHDLLWHPRSLRQPAKRSASPSRRSISRKASKPPSEDNVPPSKRATTVLPCTGGRPGRNGVASTMAGVAPVDPRVRAHHQNPTPNQHLVLHPPALTHNPG